MELSQVQIDVLEIVKLGGSLIQEDSTGKLFLSNSQGDDYRISYATWKVLLKKHYLKIGHPPALGITRYIFNFNRKEWK